MTAASILQPLVTRHIFPDEESAARELARDYILHQIETLANTTKEFRARYGMPLEQFETYLHERSQLLVSGSLDESRRQLLGQNIMREEDDWLEWKAAARHAGRLVGAAKRTCEVSA